MFGKLKLDAKTRVKALEIIQEHQKKNSEMMEKAVERFGASITSTIKAELKDQLEKNGLTYKE